MAQQEQLNRSAIRYLTTLRATIEVLWRKACEVDGIPPESKFVVFSDGNKYAQFHQIAMRQFIAARQEFADGGYVGLQIVDGKAW